MVLYAFPNAVACCSPCLQTYIVYGRGLELSSGCSLSLGSRVKKTVVSMWMMLELVFAPICLAFGYYD